MKTLNDVLNFLSDIPTINQGGCVISAFAVYKWLKKNNSLSDDFAILYLHYWDSDDMEVNTAFLSGESEEVTSCSHAIFRYNGKLYDSNGEHSIQPGTVYTLEITVEHIDRFVQASLKSYNWNSSFNRHRFVPQIEKELELELEVSLDY